MFQLHPNGYQFAAGHVAKLELLPKDTEPGPAGSYGRASNDQQHVTVANLELRLPVVEHPGSQNGLVKQPAPRVLPDGYALAADYAGLPDLRPTLEQTKLKRKGPKLFANVGCPTEWASCNNVKVNVTTKAPDAGKKPNKVASRTYKFGSARQRPQGRDEADEEGQALSATEVAAQGLRADQLGRDGRGRGHEGDGGREGQGRRERRRLLGAESALSRGY